MHYDCYSSGPLELRVRHKDRSTGALLVGKILCFYDFWGYLYLGFPPVFLSITFPMKKMKISSVAPGCRMIVEEQ